MIWNQQQAQIIDNAVNHILHGNQQVYQFTGFAGTGKTTVLMEIIKRIGIPLHRIAPMTYIGQAAIVMRSKGLYNAKTAHSWVFELVEELVEEDGKPIIDPVFNKPMVKLVFRPKPVSAFDDIDYIIIDEAYTIPIEMKPYIERLGKKIIACGDPWQLPPVKSKPAYLVDGKIDRLTEIVRQDKNSGIAYIAERARLGLPIHTGLYGNVLVVEQNEITDEMIMNSCIVICGKNKTREYFNNRVRNDIMKFKTELPTLGEKIICRKNNWNIDIDGISLANGLIGSVIKAPSVSNFDGKQFYIDFKPDLLNAYFPNLNCDYKYFTASMDMKPFIKNDKYSKGEKFEFAYAITTHLSQGAQYPNGIL